MTTADYRVLLDSFEGPLDLLLFLIRRAEVDVHDIPVALIASQYLEYLNLNIKTVDLEAAGDFLVMAATLMEVKSRMLSWQPGQALPAEDPGAKSDAFEDPRADLVRQLLAFKQYRDASNELETRMEEWQRRAPAGAHGPVKIDAVAEDPDAPADLAMDELSLMDLIEAFRAIVTSVNFDRVGDHQVTYDDTPIELHAEDILERIRSSSLGSGTSLSMRQIFEGRKRGEMIGLFLAMLELVRRRAIRVKQDSTRGDITVEASDESPDQQIQPTQ